jgi:hypothetical protein
MYLLYILLKTLPFSPAERLWPLELGSSVERGKSANSCFFLSRSALLLFSHSFFFALSRSFLLRVCEREKNAGAHLWFDNSCWPGLVG